MRTEAAEGLYLPQVVDLLDGVEVVFHAFDSHVLAGLDALRLQYFREGAFSLFAN